MQQNNCQKHASKSTSELLKKKELRFCIGLIKVPQPIEILWWDLKRSGHKQMPKNLNKLKQCYKEGVKKSM